MVKERTAIDEKYKWSIDEMFSSGDLDGEIENIKSRINEVDSLGKEGIESSEKLLQTLDLYFDISREIEHLKKYCRMKKDQDTRSQDAQAMLSKVKGLESSFQSSSGFIKPNIVSLGEIKVNEFVNQSPDLEKYEHYFENLFRMKDHILEEGEEEIIASLGDVTDAPYEAYSAFTNADLKFPEMEKESGEKVEITLSNFTKLQKNSDRDLRRKSFEKFYDTLGNYRNTISTTLDKNVRKNVRRAEIRGYGSAREASMKPENIPLEVHDNLIEVIRENLSLLHRHARFKKQVLDVGELEMYDLYMPVVEGEGPNITFEEAKNYVLDALRPLGEEYVSKVESGIRDEGWIDLYPNRGKRSGAYSAGSYDSKPYILMNFQNDINSLYTLAHELGHSMHSYYSNNNQPYVYSDYTIFQAEVASTTNEVLLTNYLLENVDDEYFRSHVLSHVLENLRGTLFRQTMFSEFEKRIHEDVENGDALNSEKLDKKYIELKKAYYKPAKISEGIEKEWMKIPHFYYNFYVYKYATGISAGNLMAEKIMEEGPEDYIQFLKKGGSDYSLQTLKHAGVDMSSTYPINKTLENYENYLNEVEELHH